MSVSVESGTHRGGFLSPHQRPHVSILKAVFKSVFLARVVSVALTLILTSQ